MKAFKDVDFSGRKVLLRVDFNVPLQNGIITDDTRMKESLPTIKKLLADGAAVIIMAPLAVLLAQVSRPTSRWHPWLSIWKR